MLTALCTTIVGRRTCAVRLNEHRKCFVDTDWAFDVDGLPLLCIESRALHLVFRLSGVVLRLRCHRIDI